MIRGLLFDKDGTLFDFQGTWGVWASGFLAKLAGEDAALSARLCEAVSYDPQSRSFAPDSPVIAGTADEIVALLIPHLPGTTFDALYEEVLVTTAVAPQAPAVPLAPLLARFRAAGLKLGVATNDSERAARGNLDSAGVTAGFDFIAGYDSGYGAKPGPGMCLAFCDAMGLAPDDVAMVGDSTHDLEAGRAAGMSTIAVLTGVAGEDVLAPMADVVLPDIGHIPDWLSL